MSEPRFYCESLPDIGEIAHLRGDEARHATASRRLKTGDMLWLFDGRGGVARASVRALTDRGREVETVIETREQLPPIQPIVHLACALPKGDRAAVLMDMGTQLGISAFTPLLCEHSVVKPGDGTLDRLRRIALEACKQSRRAHLPELHEPASINDAMSRGGTIWIAHPDGKPVNQLLSVASGAPITILVGPEGGFTDDEVNDAVANGAVRVALGKNILRVETAAIALVGLIMLGAQAPSGT